MPRKNQSQPAPSPRSTCLFGEGALRNLSVADGRIPTALKKYALFDGEVNEDYRHDAGEPKKAPVSPPTPLQTDLFPFFLLSLFFHATSTDMSIYQGTGTSRYAEFRRAKAAFKKACKEAEETKMATDERNA